MTSQKNKPRTTSRLSQPIAVVGIGCRFPDADDAEQFWQNIEAGHTSFSDVPADRWDHSYFETKSQRDVDKSWVGRGSFIRDYRSFAAMHYGIPPRRVEVMDPQQRLLIEATRSAVQDAGYEARDFPKARTGVYVGLSVNEHKSIAGARLLAMQIASGQFGAAAGTAELREALLRMTDQVAPMRAFTLSGNLSSMSATAVAQTFDFGGPAYTLDAACAAASVAVHDAVTQLRVGAVDVGIAGGAYLNLSPDNLVAFTKIGAISPSGICRPFEARSDGFVQSDGVGVVFLKRLDDALADGDRIYALIRGSACNNDGRGEGPMTPRFEGQVNVLEAAYDDAQIDPASVAYFEAHGTATVIGDPVEVSALRSVLESRSATAETPAFLGSVKGNIGHAMSAAGIAGLIKGIKLVEHRVAPPHPGFENPNPKLELDASPLQVAVEATPLAPTGSGPLRVGVSSFGFGGTNSHIVLEEAPSRAPAAARTPELSSSTWPHAVIVTAPTPVLLAQHLNELAAEVEARRLSLEDVAFTMNATRTYERYRAVVVASTTEEFSARARDASQLVDGDAYPHHCSPHVVVYDEGEEPTGPPQLAFLFPGQGAQKVGLLADLQKRFSSFADALAISETALLDLLPQTLASYLYPEVADEAAETRLRATEVCQPAMAALGLATDALLKSIGIEPSVTLGHSLGEFAALSAGGALNSIDAVRLVARRGAAMADLNLEDSGTMAAVMASADDVAPHLVEIDGVAIANLNHPDQVSLSGTTAGVDAASTALQAAGLDVRPLSVSHAFHSPLLEGVRAPMADLLEEIELEAPQATVASCIAEDAHGADPSAIKAVLLDHATAPVNFVRGLEQAKAAGATVFIQVGAGSMLTSFARATLGRETPVFDLSRGGKDGGAGIVRAAAELAALGVPVDFNALLSDEAPQIITLPETPLERAPYWIVKDAPQPITELKNPLPRAGQRSFDLVGDSPGSMTPDVPSAPEPSDDLVALFRQQNALLEAHAEILANQTKMLLGQAPVEARVSEILTESSELPVRKPAPASQRAVEPAPAPDAPVAASAAPTAVAEDEVREKVVGIVARISAFPRKSVRANQRLVDELGFDSLMVNDLGAAIEKEYPVAGAPPASVFSLQTTVEDIADHMVQAVLRPGTVVESVAEDEPEALSAALRYRVAAAPRKRVSLSARSFSGETWLVTEDASELSSSISRRLEAEGVRLVRVRFSNNGVASPATVSLGKLNLWPESFVEGLPKALANADLVIDGCVHAAGLGLSNTRDFVNPVPTLHALAKAMNPKTVAIITGLGGQLGLEPGPMLSRNVLQSALNGYGKALARERTKSSVRVLDVDPTEDPMTTASWIIEELACADRTTEVGFVGGARYVSELQEDYETSTSKRKVRADDVVVITGGAGEIGALVAKRMVSRRPKAVILVGRRQPDARIETLIGELGTSQTVVRYISADITDQRSLAGAIGPLVRELGEVTVAIHAAGVIEDAPASKKTLESIERVMDAKVLGLQSVLHTFPSLKDLVLFSSWAGRFGNAGQVDYSAANAVLDHIAVAGVGGTRTLAIAWPPWASTAMVRSIPEGIRTAMRREGVTFLEDEEGLAIFDDLFESGTVGTRVIGRALPTREVGLAHVQSFALSENPFLADHKLQGQPVVPLASAADLMGWCFSEVADGKGALVLDGLELSRGIKGDEVASVDLRGRHTADGFDAARIDVRVDGAMAYRASAKTLRVGGKLEGFDLSGELLDAGLELAAFYRDRTFHGPMLQGIASVDDFRTDGIAGAVRTSHAGDWMPESNRRSWTIDPLVLDASFQLAGYWVSSQQDRMGYPIGFKRFTMVRPFGSGQVLCRMRLTEITEDRFSGDIFYCDELGAPYALLEGIMGRFAEVRAAPTKPKPVDTVIAEETYNVAKFPEVELLDQRFEMAKLMGLENPYFHTHAGTARDTSVIEGVEMVNYSSYNYLGYSGHPDVVGAAKDAIEKYGTSVSASRVASGERPIHRELEQKIAAHVGVEDSIVFVSGHATNVTTIGHLFDRNDLIIHDSLIHDSILQGIYLSGATRRPYPHGDLDKLEEALTQVRGEYRRVLICAEGIYSMDGDICDLPRMIEIKKRFGAMLLVDEAHSIGVLGPSGRGIAHHFDGVDPNDVDLWMGTLSKSFASCGGYIAGSEALVRYLKYTAPGFVYSAGITPANAAAALQALDMMNAEPENVERLRDNSRFFMNHANKHGIDTGLAMGAAVVPAIIGNSLECMQLSARLAQRRINVQPIVYPAVEDDAARLRFFISSTHTREQLSRTVEILVEEWDKIKSGEAAEEAAPNAPH